MLNSTIRDVHIGIVTDNEDEEQRGRIKIASATLCGIDENGDPLEYPDFISPCYPVLFSDDGTTTNGGWFFIPSVGTFVEVVVPAKSDMDRTMGSTPGDVRWRASIWPKGSADGVPEEFKTNYPQRRGIKTERGHFLLFDDTQGSEKLSLEMFSDDGISTLTFTPDGGTLLTAKSNMINLNDKDGSIDLLSSGQMLLSLHKDGILLTSKNSNMFSIDDTQDSMNIMAQGSITLQSTSVAINGGLDVYSQIPAGAGATPVVKQGIIPGMEFLTLLDAVLQEVIAIGAALQVGTGPAPIIAANAQLMSTQIGLGTYETTALKTE